MASRQYGIMTHLTLMCPRHLAAADNSPVSIPSLSTQFSEL